MKYFASWRIGENGRKHPGFQPTRAPQRLDNLIDCAVSLISLQAIEIIDLAPVCRILC